MKIVKDNLKTCGFTAPVLQQDAVAYLHGGGKFDLIFIDPPYDAGLYDKVLETVNSVDNLTDGGIIVCESRRETPMPEMTAPYFKRREYRYGKVKLTMYGKE